MCSQKWKWFYFCFLSFSISAKPIDIAVGGYLFTPYVVKDENGKYSGVTVSLIDELNRRQGKYNFVFNITSPYRRYADFDKKMDIFMFEDERWGWKKKKVYFSPSVVKYIECFVTRANEKRPINELALIGVRGYNYDYISNNKPAFLLHDDDKLFDALLRGRGDLIQVNSFRLKQYLNKNPSTKSAFEISGEFVKFDLKFIFNSNSKISQDEFFKIWKGVLDEGAYKYVMRKHGLGYLVDGENHNDNCSF